MEECIICFEETENFMFFPCQHKVCRICFPKLERCPLCQRNKILTESPSYFNLCCSIVIIIGFCVWCIHIIKMV